MFVLYLVIGLVMLVAGAELLVRGGGQLALAMRIPALVVGLTVVAFGTSTPELMVSLTAALKGSTEMALANVNGSNIANIALVLGAVALVRPLIVDRTLMRREVPTCLALQLALPLLCLDGILGRFDGAMILMGGLAYNVWLIFEALRGRAPPMDDDLEAAEATPWYVHVVMLVVGIAVLIVGANVFVAGAEEVARWFNLSERFIGLTVVALGTSAPELATGLVSAQRGEVELAVGNSLGSNIINISLVLGITAIIQPILLHDQGAWGDMSAAFVVTALLIPIVLVGRLGRGPALLMCGGYFTYIGADFLF